MGNVTDDTMGPTPDRTIDHVSFAGTDLDVLRETFERAGFEPEYGGAHSNGITHMAAIGFEDRSYIELISKREGMAEKKSPWWNEQIETDAGAAAWAVPSNAIGEDVARLRTDGLPVDDPEPFHRERPNGERIEWELAGIGEGPLGTTYPMLIMDHTPVERRVNVTATTETTGLVGVRTVIVGTTAARSDALVDGFETVFDSRRSSTVEYPDLGVQITHFEEAPVGVAVPLEEQTWLGERVETHGTLPCAYLLDATSETVALDRFTISGTTEWTGGTVHWIDVSVGGKVGIFAAER